MKNILPAKLILQSIQARNNIIPNCMAYTKLIPRHAKDARIEGIPRDTLHYPLSVTAGKADKYHLAQPDDYAHVLRSEFPLAVPT